jgi:hypothetical protein
VNRRAAVIPILLLAVTATGCSTFSDNDAAARVSDFELSQDELDDLLAAASPTTLPGAESDDLGRNADTARSLLNTWIITRILEVDLAAQGQSISPQAIADATGALAALDPDGWANVPVGLQTLQVEQRAAVDTWSALPAPSDDELRALYEAGTEASGFVCSAHILVATEAQANDILDQLEGGADFAELAGSESIDTGSVANGGKLPCDTTGNFEAAYAPEFVEVALAANLGEPVGPVKSEFGYHVIMLRPSDNVDSGELTPMFADPALRFQRTANGLDIYVDPRFGSFNSVSGVEALG